MKKVILILMFFFSIVLSSCKEFNLNKSTTLKYEDKILEQKVNFNLNLYIDSEKNSFFKIPVIVGIDYSPYKNYKNGTNANLYLSHFEGDNIEDVSLKDIEVTTISKNSNLHACVFKLEIKGKSGWNSTLKNRNINKLYFNLCGDEVCINTDINIYDVSLTNQSIAECSILDSYEINKEYCEVSFDNEYSFSNIINFDCKGWGAVYNTDPQYSTLKRIELVNDLFEINDFTITQLSFDSATNTFKDLDTRYDDISNINFKIRTENQAGFKFSFNISKSQKCDNSFYFNDELVFVYTLNEENIEYKVNIRNIQYSNYSELFDLYI